MSYFEFTNLGQFNAWHNQIINDMDLIGPDGKGRIGVRASDGVPMPNKERTTDYTDPVTHQDAGRTDPQDRDLRVIAGVQIGEYIQDKDGQQVLFENLPSGPTNGKTERDLAWVNAEEFNPLFDENGDLIPRDKEFNSPGPGEKDKNGDRQPGQPQLPEQGQGQP